MMMLGDHDVNGGEKCVLPSTKHCIPYMVAPSAQDLQRQAPPLSYYQP